MPEGSTGRSKTAHNSGEAVAFGTIVFGLDDVGTHTYTVREKASTVAGVDSDDTVYTVTARVTRNAQGELQVAASIRHAAGSADELRFNNRYALTGFTVTKVWDGADGGSIALTLYADGVKLDPQPTYTRQGSDYVYDNLPTYSPAGDFIVYSAKERVPAGYVAIYKNIAPYENVTNVVHDGGTIVNREVTDILVRKEWSGLAGGTAAPEIELTLYRDGKVISRKPKKEADGWYRFANLPISSSPYYVVETPISGCVATYENKGVYADVTDRAYNGGTITNHVIPDTGDRTNLSFYVLTLVGAALGMLALMRAGKNRKRA